MTLPTAAARVGSLLIVDDSSVQRAHAVALCRELGVNNIYEAASGAEALELLSLLVLPPDLLILDLEMPGMDGVELIEQLHRRQIALPLMIASSREHALIQSVETLARNLGMTVLAGLQKPLKIELVHEALRRFDPAAPGLHDVPAEDPATAPSASELAAAIAAGEIGVHYQPKIDMRTGIVRGVEALARWHRPATGFVRPDRFVALAEREGLIHDLTRAVMSQALAQAAAWNQSGLKLKLAVNLSPMLLDRPSLVQEISGLAESHGVPPEQLVLEITESSVVDCMGSALGVLARLRLKGFGLSIDDYGTGFSSMQQLARIPFTELKIDRSFVHGAHRRHNLRVILRSALDMARQLDLVTVAEGIETIEDWRLLQDCGCVVGQGWLIAKPMPAEEIPLWLRRHPYSINLLRAEAPALAR